MAVRMSLPDIFSEIWIDIQHLSNSLIYWMLLKHVLWIHDNQNLSFSDDLTHFLCKMQVVPAIFLQNTKATSEKGF